MNQSRFGFHSCGYEDYTTLKTAHKLVLRAYKDCKKWIRWNNKTVHRSPIEPCAPDLVEFGMHYKFGEHCVVKKKWYGYGFRKAGPNNLNNLYSAILNEYRNARTPRSNPEDTVPINMSMLNTAKQMIAYLNAFYEQDNVIEKHADCCKN